jgi:REP element-mobilizing transposase RayT
VEQGKGLQSPNPARQALAESLLVEQVCTLSPEQRRLVEATIADHCRIRGWELHAVNCRTNHVHIIVTADRAPGDVREQFKAWCSRRLKELQRRQTAPGKPIRTKWWTEGGSARFLNDTAGLEAAIRYVLEGQ